MLKIVYRICCGTDVHKSFVVACIASTNEQGVTTYKSKRFSTFTGDLRRCAAWLAENNCKDVCMESTGKYWIPVYNILEPTCKTVLAHPKYVKVIRGKKTDKRDAKWIADIFKHDLVAGSFIPPADIRQLRDLVRYHWKLINFTTGEKNRAQNCLTVSNFKLDDVFSNVFGAYIKPLLVQCTLCAIRAKQFPEVRNRYLALKKRRGHKKAIIAIARMLLTAIYNMLKKNEPYNSQGEQVKVIWIYGPAGTGKNSLAKAYAEKAGQEYYISGSSRDIFQGYGGEHTLIMDELRPKTIPYHDLLRILDPFSLTDPTMAPSRYTDKAIACDLIIITMPFDPLSFYQKEFGSELDVSRVDSFDQLLRRLTLIMYMNDDAMEVVTYNFYGFQFVPGTVVKNPYSTKNRPAPKVDGMAIYRSIVDGTVPVDDTATEKEGG